MTRHRARTHRPCTALTLRQMMKLVVFGAVGSLCLAPMMRLAEIGAVGWPFAILMEAVAIPMVLALAAFPMVSRGPQKDWLIRGLLMTSLAVILGSAIYSLAWGSAGPQSLNIWAAGSGIGVGFLRSVISLVGFGLILLLRQIVPGFCPDCRWSPLVADATIRVRPDAAWERAFRCVSCKGRFRKYGGSWSIVSFDRVPPTTSFAERRDSVA